MIYENFPEKLRELPQWVVWRYETNEKDKPTKVLYSTKGYKASTTKSTTWSTFKECVTTFEVEEYNGVGFVFTQGVIGIDLDKCINEDGSVKQWAKDILNIFDSYTEYSPSKTGLHIILESDIDFGGHKKEWLNEAKEKEGVECYMRSRYFTVTGNVFEDRKELKHIDESHLFDWYKNTFEPNEKMIVEITPRLNILPSDDDMLAFMRNARNGMRFIDLYDKGNYVGQGFPSQSEADMSLVNSLMFFCRNDTSTVDRLFKRSKLYRKKWDRPDYKTELLRKCYRLQMMDWSRPEECDEPEDELVIRSMAGVKPTNVKWLWRSRLAKGKLTLFQGDPGQGKSQVTIYIASVISKGDKFVDDFECEQGQVLFITAEDDAADTLKPRLMAQDANMDNIFELQWIKTAQGKTELFNFDKYMDDLKKATKSLKDLRLIVVDPISAFLGGKDGNSTGDVRGLLYELKTIAEEMDCAVILVTHNNKNTSQKAVSRASGSHAFGAAARMVYAFGLKPPEDGGSDDGEAHFGSSPPKECEFCMVPVKNNLTKDPDTLVYIIQSTYVFSDDDDEISTSKIVWHGTTNATAQEVVDYNPLKRSKTGPGRPDDTFQECKTEIEMLTWGKELVTAEDLKRIMGDLTKFSASMIRKARIAIGFTTLVTNNNEVTWVREKGQLQTNTENNG